MTVTEAAPAAGLRLALRDYQEEAIAGVVDAAANRSRRLLGVAATGLGKTVIFSTLAARLAETGLDLPSTDVLVLAHRDELIGQAVDKLRTVWPGAPVGVVMARDDHVRAPVVVASVQTLAREKRLARIENRRFGLIVVDEAHHAAAASYRRILDRLGAGDPERGDAAPALEDRPVLLGVTATPDRADRVGLDVVFDEVVFSYDLLWGIRAGYLSDLRGVRVVLDLDLSKIRTRAGDYADGELAEALGKANAAGHAVAAYEAHAAGRKALIFTANVAAAHEMAETFRAAGIAAEAVSGETARDERRAILGRLSTGETKVVANCNVLTEGFDEPSVDAIVVARPTKSRSLYVQMVGRGTRRHPGKDDCVVLDLVGVTDDHDLVTLPDLAGLPVDALRGGAVGLASAVDAAAATAAVVDEAARIAAREVSLWERRFREARLNWVEQRGVWVLSAEAGFVALEEDGSGAWRTVVKPRKGSFRTLVAGVDLDTAMSVGEDHVRRWAMRVAVRATAAARGRTSLSEAEVDEAIDRGAVDAREVSKATALIRADAGWRRNPPTARQSSFAESLGLDPNDYSTAGDLSDAIDAKRAVSKLRARK